MYNIRINKMKYSLLIFVLLFSISIGKADNVTFKPNIAKQGQNISCFYTPDKSINKIDSVFIVLYSYNVKSKTPIAKEFSLDINSQQKRYEGIINIPNDAEFAVAKIISFSDGEKNTYSNFGNNYPFLIYNNDTSPIKNSNMLSSLYYLGSNDYGVDVNTDYAKSTELLKQEIDLYPNNMQAQIGLTSLLYDLKKIYKSDYESLMKDHLKKPYSTDNEGQVSSRIKALRTLDMQSDANKLEKEYILKNPKSKIAEEKLLNEMKKVSTQKEFIDLAKQFFRNYPFSDQRQTIVNAVVTAYLQKYDYKNLIEFIQTQNLNSPDIKIELANVIIKNKKILPLLTLNEKQDSAVSLFNQGLDEYMTMFHNKKSLKPIYMSKFEYAEYSNSKLAGFYTVAGNIYNKFDKNKALEYYNKALNISPNPGEQLYGKVAYLYNKTKDFNNTYSICKKAITNSIFFEDVKELYIESSKKYNSWDNKRADNELNSLLDIATAKRFESLNNKQLNVSVKDIYLKTVSDKVIELADFEGRITIINFWASWCVPCQSTIPAIDEIYELYKNDPKVEFISINVWEQDDDSKKKIENFIDTYEAEYKIYYDETNTSMRNLSLGGLPSTIILDKKGLLRFKISGFTNSDNFILKVTDIVDFLMKK